MVELLDNSMVEEDGNQLAMTAVKPGMTVLKLGLGTRIGLRLASNRVGELGYVIAVDMTDSVLKRAHEDASASGMHNVEFRKGFIEKLPVDDASVDFVFSNCVMNISKDKQAVFREIQRVLKPGGRFAVSNLVLLKPLSDAVMHEIRSYFGCIAGAIPMNEYVALAAGAGLRELTVPRLTHGKDLVEVRIPIWTGCCGTSKTTCCGRPINNGSQLVREAAEAVVSIVLQGSK